MDVLKALIVGPECSPYKNGLFAFDIFLPTQYNQISPLVKITTTAEGQVRFGPNLYADGKVRFDGKTILAVTAVLTFLSPLSKGLPVASWHLVWAWLEPGQVDITAGAALHQLARHG